MSVPQKKKNPTGHKLEEVVVKGCFEDKSLHEHEGRSDNHKKKKKNLPEGESNELKKLAPFS